MFRFSYTVAAILLLLSACKTIHEYPEGPGVDPSLIDVNLSVAINMDLNDEDPIIQTYRDMLLSGFDIRYIVEIYKVADSYGETVGNLVRRIERIESDIIENGIYEVDEEVKLHAGLYSVMVWVDFIKKGTDTDYYYDTSNLHQIKTIGVDGVYNGYDATKDAFSAQKSMDLIPYANERFVNYDMEVPVKRPFAVYRVVAKDLAEYISDFPEMPYPSIKPVRTNAKYSLYFPMGYNVYYGVPENMKSNVSYVYDIVETVEGEEAVIASDMVFVDDNETFYYLNFSIYTEEGKLITTSKEIKINLERNRMTIVEGNFLTRDVDDGEIGIDPGFEDEIVVPIG